MTLDHAIAKINQSYFYEKHKKMAVRIAHEIWETDNLNKLNAIRYYLMDQSKKHERTKFHGVLSLAIMTVKIRINEVTGSISGGHSYNHTLSDHALIKYLERMFGFDVIKAKDYVLRHHANNNELEAIVSHGKYITFLPKEYRGLKK